MVYRIIFRSISRLFGKKQHLTWMAVFKPGECVCVSVACVNAGISTLEKSKIKKLAKFVSSNKSCFNSDKSRPTGCVRSIQIHFRVLLLLFQIWINLLSNKANTCIQYFEYRRAGKFWKAAKKFFEGVFYASCNSEMLLSFCCTHIKVLSREGLCAL